ncbi:MAG: alkaline phosphatase family protein [Candidatus Thermoplasmatota archaeon]|nr:alkaline phosphatase family protein [Candidatus Thermoplasmatota archaeon]
MIQKKAIVIGFDGGAFEILEPWLQEGKLPNIEMIMENGVIADMESQLPPVTSPNWKCYSTGMNPGKLGLFWWENVDVENRKVTYPQERTMKKTEYWDILEGKKAVINMPTTFPPKEIDGFVISGPPDTPNDDFYRPRDLKDLMDKFGYKIRPERHYMREGPRKKKLKAAEEMLDIIETKFDFTAHLIENNDLDFIHLTIFYINVLQHFFWNDQPTKKGWMLIDDKIGEFIERFGDDYTFFFMSDHGSNKIKNVLNINTWLEEKGYLVTKMGKEKTLDALGLNMQNISRIANYVFSKKTLDKLQEKLPDYLMDEIPEKGGTLRKEQKGKVIDWDKSRAVASGQGPVYLIGDEGEKEKIKEELLEDFDELVEKGLVERVFEREDIYWGEYVEEGPDLILDQGQGVHITGDVGKEKSIDKPGRWKGENKKTGMFMAYGDEIREDEKIKEFSILDIAPTVLHFYSKKIPKEVDGDVKKEVFDKGSDIFKRKVTVKTKRGKEEEEKLDSAISKLDI